MESDPGWAEKIREFVAGNDNVKVIFARSMGFAQATPPQLKYDIHFDEIFDLVMIDGPGEHFEGIARKQGATVNALELNRPGLVLVDGRKATVSYMKEKMSGYECNQSDLHAAAPVKPGYNYFSVFLRN